jgi:transposase
VARKSRCKIVLSGEERAELERRVACYTLPREVVRRAKMILYAAQGLSNVEIAGRLETSPEVVGRWRKCSFEQRLAGLEDRARSGRPRRSPPEQVAEVKAIACELPRTQGLPLSRFSRAELHRLVVERGSCEASASTIARWLAEDAIEPWRYRSWIFPTDPDFLEKTGARSTSPRAVGRGSSCTRVSSTSAPTRSPRSRPGGGSTRRCLPAQAGASGSSTPTSGRGRSPSTGRSSRSPPEHDRSCAATAKKSGPPPSR